MAKYFAVIPAIFASASCPPAVPHSSVSFTDAAGHSASAILSALIFNAVVIPLLIPVALRGVAYRPVGADALLRRNLLIYGLGGGARPIHRNQTD